MILRIDDVIASAKRPEIPEHPIMWFFIKLFK
jgi:hypothetical protein